MSCRDEHHDHDHGGDDHHHHHSALDHVKPLNTSHSISLHNRIDLTKVRALNEVNPGDVKKIFKPHEKRFEADGVLESDCDEQLIIFVQFTGVVKLYSLLLRSFSDDSAPNKIKLYKNNDSLDFDNVESVAATYEFEYPFNVGLDAEDERTDEITDDETAGIVENFLPRHLFASVTHLAIFIETNHGADTTKLLYLDFRGEFSELTKDPVITLYEAAANPKDHKNIVPGENLGHQAM